MEVSIHEDNEVSSLRKTNRILKYFFIALSILAIIPLVLTIVYAHKKIQTQSEIEQKRQTLTTLQQQLQQQNYIYQFGSMNISEFTITLDQNTNSRPVKTIELQDNSLYQFKGNIIPGVQTLILDNNPLKRFCDNYFPQLYNLSIMTGALDEFSNNSLVSVKDMKTNSKIDRFEGNHISLSALKINTKSFVGNDLAQLATLQFFVNSSFNFTQNSLPNLNRLTFHEPDVPEKMNFTISNNLAGKLADLNISGLFYNHHWNIQYNNFSLLANLTFTDNSSIESISHNLFPSLLRMTLEDSPRQLDDACPLSINNNSMPNLVNLTANAFSQIISFSKNNLSSLKSIDFSGNVIQNLSENVFTSLEYANFSFNSLRVFGLDAPNIKTLDISWNPLPSIDTLVCPELQTFILERVILQQLTNVSLPSLKVLKAFTGKLTSIKIQNGTNILQAHLGYNSLAQFAEPWSNLNLLDLTGNRLASFNATLYKNLSNLTLPYNRLTSIYLGSSAELKYLDLESNNFPYFNTSFYTSLPALETLSLHNNSLKQIQIIGPSIVNLTCSSNSLLAIRTINCPQVKHLNIENNNITQISGLVNHTFETFRALGNPITTISNNEFRISTISGIPLVTLQKFENNVITSFTTEASPIQLKMGSQALNVFKDNDLTFGRILFTAATKNLTEVFKNVLTVRNGDVTINSPNLGYFVQNTLYFCNEVALTNTSLTTFENNTFFNVTSLKIMNNKMSKFKNNSARGVKNIYLDSNLLTNSIVDELVEMSLGDIRTISLVNNTGINKTDAEARLKAAYPNATIVL